MEKNLMEQIGKILKNTPELHDTEYEVGFNMHTNTFFRKMVSKEVIDKGVRMGSDDFYKGLVVLNYYCTILQNDYSVCDNLVKISKTLRKHEKDMGKDEMLSYLTLDMLTSELGLYAQENNNSSGLKAIESRYSSFGNIKTGDLKEADPYYQSISQMAYDLSSPTLSKYFTGAKSRSDIESVVFCDALWKNIKDEKIKVSIDEELKKEEYLKASMIALDGLKKEADRDKLLTLIKNHLKV